jgi:[ribosomal protein S18]-alanine N-acetyltransferase
MRCRLYMPDDFSELYAIEEICFWPPLRFDVRYMRQLVNSSNAVTWIAEENGHIVGFAIVKWTRPSRELIAYIETLEVSPEHRRKGIGGELLRRTEESARATDARAIRLHVDTENAGAIHIYQEHGFVCEGRVENYYSRCRAALIYSKPLESVN